MLHLHYIVLFEIIIGCISEKQGASYAFVGDLNSRVPFLRGACDGVTLDAIVAVSQRSREPLADQPCYSSPALCHLQ